jgi:hypothetical protein
MNSIKLFILCNILWYYHVYSDMDWNTLYLKRSFSFEDKLIHKKKVIKKFWHLKYFFKWKLWEDTKLKISSKRFKNSIINVEHCFTDNLFDR